MTPEEIKLNMAVMTPHGKGVVVGWGAPDCSPYLVKIGGYSGHDGGRYSLIAGSKETLDEDGCWCSAEDLTAIEEPTHYAEWEKLTPLPKKPRTEEKIGAKFVVVGRGTPYFKQGEIVKLVMNDGTCIPYFKSIDKNELIACFFHLLAPLPQNETVDHVSNAIKNAGLTVEELIEFSKKASFSTYKEIKRNDEDVRSYNVGNSDYAKHKIQPWDVWLDHRINPWEGDIIKRVIRRKKGQDRREDFEKIIHIAQELIRQIDNGEYVDYKLMAEENKELKKKIEELQNENKNNHC